MFQGTHEAGWEPRRQPTTLPSTGLDADVDRLWAAVWREPEASVRRALLTVRVGVLSSYEPAATARAWLALAHGLVVTDPEAAVGAAEEAVRRCAADRPDLLDEALALAALLGVGAAERPPLGPHGPLLFHAARLATEGGVDHAGAVLDALRALPEPARPHGQRWAALAEQAAGLALYGARAGRPVVFDAHESTIAVEGQAPVSLGRSRRRFDLLLAVALWPDLEREALFEQVWGHAWRGASSKNSLHASVSRARAAVPGLEAVSTDGGYAFEEPLTVYLRGPAPQRRRADRDPLFGRDDDLRTLRRALAPGAWVALWGPPGVGKSRLAREIARTWGDRVRFVELRGVRTRDGLQAEVARVLGTTVDDLALALDARETLLVLDDLDELEHVDLGGLLAAWRRSGRVRVLTTQRHRVPADHLHETTPLGVEDGVALLRAQAPSLGQARAEALAAGLDGLPLALEIAGRHLHRLPDDEVGVGRALHDDGPLAAAMALSWEGLSDGARSALARLAVLDLGLPTAAARAVLGPLGSWADDLEARALIRRDGERVVLLRAVRHFAVRHLAAEARVDAVEALADWALALEPEAMHAQTRLLLAIEAAAVEVAPERAVRLALVLAPGLQEAAPPDVLVAMLDQARALADPAQHDEVDVARALERFAAGDSPGARAILDPLQERLEGDLLAKALLVRAKLARTSRDPGVDAALDRAVEACTQDDLREALTVRGFHRLLARRLVEGRADFERAHRISERIGRAAEARARANLGIVATTEGRLRDGERMFEQAVPELEGLGQIRILRHALHNLAFVRHRIGSLDAAEQAALRALEFHETLGQPARAASTRLGLASIALDRGDLELALRRAYRAQADGRGVERAAWVVREAEGLAAAAHLELGQVDAARALIQDGERSITNLLAQVMIAALERDAERVDELLVASTEFVLSGSQGTTDFSAVHAVAAVLREHLGLLGGPDHLRRARERLEPDEGTARCIVEAAEHVVEGRPLVDPVPPSHLARMLLRFGA